MIIDLRQPLGGDAERVVVIEYLNHWGERGRRRILPQGIRFAVSVWHPEMQWLLDALDLDKNALRSFALRDISAWTTCDGGAAGDDAKHGVLPQI